MSFELISFEFKTMVKIVFYLKMYAHFPYYLFFINGIAVLRQGLPEWLVDKHCWNLHLE